MNWGAQREKIEAFARLYGYEIVAVVEDAGVSAKTLDRLGLRTALGYRLVSVGEQIDTATVAGRLGLNVG